MTQPGTRRTNGSIANLPIAERIWHNYPAMTDALRRFADFVLAQPVDVARMSIHSAVKDLGVSVATANRFARAIGFSGYSEFRNELICGFETALEPVRRLEAGISKSSTSFDVVSQSLREDIENIGETLQQLTPERAERGIELVVRARRILVLGFDNGFSLGAILSNGLQRLRDNVATVANFEGAIGAARQLLGFGPDDLLVAISFPRYVRDTIQLARLAKAHGIPILAITDSHQSPLAPLAEVSFFCRSQRSFATTSNASSLAMIEALVAAVSLRLPDTVKRAEEFTALAVPFLDMGGLPLKRK